MSTRLSGGGELGDGLGALRDGVLGQFSRKEEADSSLDLPGRQGGLLVVAGKARSLESQALEDVVDEGVHDAHAALGDAGLRVHLLEHLVDVGRVGLGPLLVGLGSRSEEHTSELQSLMRISYAVFCLKKKKHK